MSKCPVCRETFHGPRYEHECQREEKEGSPHSHVMPPRTSIPDYDSIPSHQRQEAEQRAEYGTAWRDFDAR